MPDGSSPKKFKISLIFLVVLLVGCILIASAPTLFSSSWGKQRLFAHFKSRYNVDVQCDKLSLGWFAHTEVTCLSVAQQEKKLFFSCDRVETEANLWDILFKKDVGQLHCDRPYLKLTPSLTAFFPKRIAHPMQKAGFVPMGASWNFSIPYIGALHCTKGKIELIADKMDPIVFDEIALDAEYSKEAIRAHLVCTTLQKGVQGNIQSDVNAAKIHSGMPLVKIQSTIKNLPMVGVDELVSLFEPKYRGLLVSYLGNTADLSLNGIMERGNFQVDLTAASPQLNATISAATNEERVSLTSPAHIRWTAAPQSAPMEITVTRFESKLNDWRNASFDAECSSFPTAVLNKSLPSLVGPTMTVYVSGANGLVQLEAQSPFLKLERSVFEIGNRLVLRSPTSFTYKQMQGQIHTLSLPLAGPIESALLEMQLAAEEVALDDLALHAVACKLSVQTLDQIVCTLSSDRLRANATAKYELKTGKVTFTQPLNATVVIDNALLHAVASTPACLVKPVDFVLKIDPFSFTALTPDSLAFKGSGSSNSLVLMPYAGALEIAMQNLSIPFQWNGPQHTANLAIAATVREKEQSLGSFNWQSTFTNVYYGKWDAVATNAALAIAEMPSAFLDSLIGKALFSPLLGPKFNAAIKIQGSAQEQNGTCTLSSSLLNAKSAFLLNKNRLALSGSPTQIDWTLTPEGFRVLDALFTATPSNAFELAEPTRFSINLTQLELPLPKPDLSTLQLVGTCSNPRIVITDKSSQETLVVAPLSLSFNKSKGAPLTLSADAATGKTGSISVKGTVENLSNTDISVQIKNFPTRLLDLLARLKGRTDAPFTKIFGSSIQASAQATIKNMSGPVSLNVNSPNVRASLNGSASQKGLVLHDPIYAQAKITKEMSQVFLNQVNPLGISYFYSENPVTLEVPARGFYLPFDLSDLSKLSIPNARIELGKIACRNEGNINTALALLKSKQFEKSKEMLLWFAPMDLHIKNGIAEMERTEILLSNTFDIALWGQFLLVDNYVDMVLGLTAQTLNLAFGIKNLPKDYVLTIPMKGPADNVKINSSKATTKIALLLASQQKALQDTLGKSTGGKILGGLMQQMAQLPDNGDVPPAKHPFPWEKGSSSTEPPESPREKKVHFKQKEKPLKQLLKVLK